MIDTVFLWSSKGWPQGEPPEQQWRGGTRWSPEGREAGGEAPADGRKGEGAGQDCRSSVVSGRRSLRGSE
ncbi:hypothetical protein E3N88_07623 [Mikania micrantha]|uniref:Uncharacterized protein n=1 Tax=Mikania micrantha TaxID=192012 RepID=A0A5N6PU61_9ASTR|nr:hypothetical protein E3N88_07623 [Mikania micrantha]